MNKCKNCKFYNPINEKEYWSNERNFGKCTCKKIQYTEELTKKPTDDMLLYWDCEDYAADFKVGKNFGCIHFKELK